MPSTITSELDDAIVARTAQMHDLVAEFARHPSQTGDLAGLSDLADVIVSRYRSLGATVRLVPSDGGDVLLADFAGTGARRNERPALLLGHYDTVHPRGSIPVVFEKDLLKGPGVYDMKGGLVIAEMATTVLQDVGAEHRPIRILLTPDEEIGSPSTKHIVVHEASEADFVLGLEPPHSDGLLKSSRHGSTRLRISVVGRSSHAALAPTQGINAIDELCEQLDDVRDVLAGYPDVLANIGTISGGGLTNVVPAVAQADIGLRFSTTRAETEVLDKLLSLSPKRPDAVVESSLLSNRTPWEPSGHSEQLLADVVRVAAVAGIPVGAAPTAGSADTNLTGALGIPTLDGFGALGSGAHAETEQIQLTSLPARVKLLATVLQRL